MTLRYFGLDGEMSGNDVAAGHRLIQIGVAVDTAPDGSRLSKPELFCSLIGWPPPDLPWDPNAEAVHRIPRPKILEAPRSAQVDEALYRWLIDHGVNPKVRHDQVMVGFNVGAFDGPFVQQALPKSVALFSRRYADLNPLCFALGDATGLGFEGYKKQLVAAGLEVVASTGRTEAEHDAGTDALIALGAWRHIGASLHDFGG